MTTRGAMTDQEMREALRQAMADWDAATDDQRARALAQAADLARTRHGVGEEME